MSDDPGGRGPGSQGPSIDPRFSATTVDLSGEPAGDPGPVGDAAPQLSGAKAPDGDRFRVVRPHARGGLGAVFVALDSELNREVALKRILDHHADAPTSRARFLREAEITGGLEHPGIVPVYALGRDDDGRPFYAMRLIKGDSLEVAIARYHAAGPAGQDSGERSLELRRLLRRLVDACNAVEYAHGRGVLHRDLKPGNIMAGKYGETLVVDWGLAKCVDRGDSAAAPDEPMLTPRSAGGSSDTVAGSAIGTPSYMSPEQAAGDLDRLGPASDVYSLGATLYCILTGGPPFAAADRHELLEAVKEGRFPPPRRLDPSIAPALEAICLKAMAREPAERYQSPLDMADDLERWMAGEPVSARREPFLERLRRRVWRHRTAAAVLVASMAVALGGLWAVLIVQGRANAELRRSNDRERARFDLAMDVIRRFHTGVSGDFLLEQKEFAGLRTRLLTEARDSYGQLLGLLEGQSDRRSRSALAEALFELGKLTDKIGSREEAVRLHRQSLAIRRALAAEPAADAESRAEEGRSLLALGLLRDSTGQSDEAHDLFVQARRIFESLAAEDPGGRRFRHELAGCLLDLGKVLVRPGNLAESLECDRQALAILEALVGGAPDDTSIRRDLANAHNNIGTVLREMGRTMEALDAYRHALTVREKLVEDHPGAADLRNDVGASLQVIGMLLRKTGESGKALESFEQAVAIQDALVKQHPNVAEFRMRLATSYLDLGTLLEDIGRTDRALASDRSARDILETLSQNDPGVTAFRMRLANSDTAIGDILRRAGRLDQALDSYGRARVVMEGLVRDNPGVPEFRRNLGVVTNNTATALEQAGRLAGALAEYERNRAIGEALVRDHPDTPGDRHSLAITLINIGNLKNNTNAPSEALEPLGRARALLEALIASNPEMPKYRSDLGTCLVLLGNAFGRLGRMDDARSRYEAARTTLEPLVDRNPTVTHFRQQLALAHFDLGLLLIKIGKAAESLASCERAEACWKALSELDPSDTFVSTMRATNLGLLGVVRLQAGQVEGGRSDIRRALAIMEGHPAPDSAALYNRACLRSILCGTAPRPGTAATRREADDDGDRAMEALRRAVAAGFRDLRLLRTDTDLDGIRSRPDFRLLLMDLEFPADPLAR